MSRNPFSHNPKTNRHGAFAKRDLPKGTVVAATPMIHFPSHEFATMRATEEKIGSNGQPQRGQQLLVNYCFGHDSSTVLLCPYGGGVNYINHNQTTANVRLQWADDGSASHDAAWLNETPENMDGVYGTKLVLEYVATRDVGQGEELLLDYGASWQRAWDGFVADWSDLKESREGYVSAFQSNILYGHVPLRTASEQEADPYPEYFITSCHPFLLDSRCDDISVRDVGHYHWTTDMKGFECTVMERDTTNESYVVNVHYQEDGIVGEQVVRHVPRQAIIFVEKAYSTDIHLLDAFRHPLGIPDEILPPAWRNLMVPDDGQPQEKEENDKSCAADTTPGSHCVERFASLSRVI